MRKEWEFTTCGMVVLEVCRERSNSIVLLQRFRERFAIMSFIGTGNSTWQQATPLACALNRRGIVIPRRISSSPHGRCWPTRPC